MRRLILCSSLALFFAAQAHAALVFNRGIDTSKTTIWSAADDGTGAKKIATGGLTPRVSPDGLTVVFQTTYGPPGSRPQLVAVPTAGGKRRVLLDPQWASDTFAWSPDSRTIAAVTGHEIGTKRLLLIDVATGAKRTVATGQFYGVSFSPTSGAIVYSRAARDDYPPRSSLWVAAVAGGKPMRITRSHPDVYPLWGPSSVVFARMRKPTRQFDAWKQDLFVVSPGGGAPKQLTHQHPSFLLSGLSPVSWSADGTRLLAQFGGQDTAYAQTVDPQTGRVRTVGSRPETIVGSALSRDGQLILATRGDLEGGENADVVVVPYGGGQIRVLARKAFNPDWNR